ncbi:MAG: nucleotidyltransferase family protein [Butyrivibrio sp.]|nr:nucleotidyltransferase family protein [Butyrivibrio sp.]
MKTIGIIAEFNPFHNGHKYLIDKCRKDLHADRVVVVMSGDYVQRGAPAIIDKFTRAKCAVNLGADLVIELPIYYSLGSAEYFAKGAVSILSGLGCIDYLCFGSEFPDVNKLYEISDIISNEPPVYKDVLSTGLKDGLSFPAARAKALNEQLKNTSKGYDQAEYEDLLSSPNTILGIEYLRALNKKNRFITPYAVQRVGRPFHSEELGSIPSAAGIRARLLSGLSDRVKLNAPFILDGVMPRTSIESISGYEGRFMQSNDYSALLGYKLVLEKAEGYTKYLDVTRDISNRIISNLDHIDGFSTFCNLLKTKNLVHTRISRCLMHILLNITEENMRQYKEDDFTAYARVLALRSSSSDLLKVIAENGSIPVLNRLKDADKMLSPLQKRLLDETLIASQIYNSLSCNGISSEYSLKQLVL